jgi:hypothetical protein
MIPGGPQIRSGLSEGEKNLSYTEIRTTAVQPVPIMTELFRLLTYVKIHFNITYLYA